MTFDIREHIEFNAKGRAQCPSCLLDGKTDLNLSLVPNTDGAYKCFRSCTIDQIRAAIGAEKPRSLPPQTTKAAPPAKGVVIDSNKLMAAHNKLMATDNPARRWLHDRGITDAMIEHFRLGITRAKCGDSTKPTKSVHLPAIAIPIPTADKSGWFHKKRVKPWAAKDERPDGYRKWSQYGIPAMVYITHQPSNPRETWLCEGEWDAIVLAWAVRNKFVANDIQVACFTCGAGNVPSDEELAKLKGDEVITFYDLDKAGDEGSLKVQERLKTRCRRASVPHNHLENAPEGYDVSDAIADGIPLERFCAAAAASTVWQRPPDDNPLRERLVSNDELLERAPDFTDWLVDDLLTADELFVLAASPRAGKSLMAFTLALAVARGGHFLGRPVSQGAVLYIRCEDSETKTKERELKQGWEAGLPVYWLEKFKLHELPHLETLVDELNVRLVVFDTLSRIRDASVGEGSAEMGQLIEPLQEMCKRMRCCGLLVHHTGKIKLDNTDTLDIFDTIRGSSSIRATCRGSMVLAADERNWRLCVENGWGKLDLNIMLDANTLHWRLLGNWSGPQVDVSQKDRVLEYLGKVGSAQLPQIALATGLPKKSLYEVLKRLQCDEMVEKRGERQSAVYVRKSIQQIAQLNGLLNENDHPPEKSDQLELKNAETQQQQGIEDDGDGSNAPIQQIQHVESVLNRSDVERERVSSSIQQQQQVPVSAEKVILVEKSDPQNDHFSPERPRPLKKKTEELNAETQAQQDETYSTTKTKQINKT
ncbi:MAG: AAA family ATPase, partial [Leptolyngbyaceae cyanobacterium]